MSAHFSPERIVKTLLVALGALVAAYAISDHPLYGGEPGFGTAQALIAGLGTVIALCALLPGRQASSVLLLAFVSLLSLLALEVAGEYLLGPRHRPIFRYDDRLIFKFIPNRRSTMTHATINGGGTVTHRINSQGFRGEELRPRGEMMRIVVYGDSFIHALYSTDEETFVVQLGGALARRLNRPVEAINAGVSSYGPDQIAQKMEAELPQLRPDLVVVAIFAGNDYGDLLRNKMFRLGAGAELIENRWTLDPKVRLWLDLSQKESILKRAIRSAIGSRDAAAGAAESITSTKFLLAEAEREFRDFVIDRNNVITNTHIDYYSADVSLIPDSESARYKVALMRAMLGKIHDVARRNSTPLVFMFIPHPADVSDGNDWGMSDRSRFPQYDGRNQTAPLEGAAKYLGVPYLNLYETYRPLAVQELYLRGGDDHWNAAGQKLAAHTMAEFLARAAMSQR